MNSLCRVSSINAGGPEHMRYLYEVYIYIYMYMKYIRGSRPIFILLSVA